MTELQEHIRALASANPDWSHSKIAAEARCSVSTVWRALNPERARRLDARYASRKRAWENEHDRPPCPHCGRPMTVGANRAGVETCWTCYREASDRRIRERGARIERLWKEGASLKEIAAELGWSTGHLKTEMGRLRASGRADLPRRRGRRVTEAVRHG